MDYRPALFGRGGIAVYARELARGLRVACPKDELLLWGHRLRRAQAAGAAGSGVPRGARLLAGPFPSRAQSFLARLGVGADVLARGVDVLHWTDYVELEASRCPVVATVHDVLFRELPHCYTAAMREGLDRVTRRVVRRAAGIVVPSSRSRDALVVHYSVAPECVHVVPHGLPALPDAPPAREYGRYLLYVGTLEPRKNLLRLLAAHERAQRRGAGVRMVLAGSRGWMDEEILAVVQRHDGVTWEESPHPARLAALYLGALALAYPSLGEGFGLPVLEAMGVGLPVLVGADTACSDLAADAALAVEAEDEDALTEALLRLAEDDTLRTRLGARGLLRAAEFTWERTARATRVVYEGALNS